MIEIATRFNEVKEYYFSKKLTEIAQMRKEGKSVLNLGIGSPDMAPARSTINTLINSAKKESSHAYQPYRSGDKLRLAMASYYRNTYGVNLNPNTEILPLLGSKEGIMYISLAFLNPGDEVLVPNPAYPAYAAIANLLGAKVRYFDLLETNQWQPNLQALEIQDLSRVKIMWVNYPNMPTGANTSGAVFKELVQFAKNKNILVINDNPYSMVLNNLPMSLLSYDSTMSNTLELNSLSKNFNMAGWRVGMVAGHPQYINAILQAKSNVDSGMFLPVQEAAAQALTLPNSWHLERNQVYAQRKIPALQLLKELDCQVNEDQVGMFLWAKIPNGVSSVHQWINDLLHNAHVFLTPGEIFGSNGNRFVRLSLCAPENDYVEAINRIKKWKKKALLLV